MLPVVPQHHLWQCDAADVIVTGYDTAVALSEHTLRVLRVQLVSIVLAFRTRLGHA